MSQINLQQKFNTIDTVIASVTNQSTLSPGQLQDKFLQFNQSGNLVAVDLDVSSIFPQLVVYSQNGTNLTISNYETSLTGTVTNGKCVFNLPQLGEWTLSGNFTDGSTGIETLQIGNIKQYKISFTPTVSSTLNNNSWNTIKQISNAGEGSLYWSVGDSKQITLNGYIGRVNYSNVRTSVYIVDFDHNSTLEGSGILFQGFKGYNDNTTTYITLTDTITTNNYAYGQIGSRLTLSNGAPYANMNSQDYPGTSSQYTFDYNSINNSVFGVISMYLLNSNSTTTRTVFNAFSSDLQNVIKTSSITAVSGTATYDSSAYQGTVTFTITSYKTLQNSIYDVKLYLPSEYELAGEIVHETDYTNSPINGTQTQIEFYKNNSKVKYRQNSLSTLSTYRTRSFKTGSSTTWGSMSCDVMLGYVNNSPQLVATEFGRSQGIAPLFRV